MNILNKIWPRGTGSPEPNFALATRLRGIYSARQAGKVAVDLGDDARSGPVTRTAEVLPTDNSNRRQFNLESHPQRDVEPGEDLPAVAEKEKGEKEFSGFAAAMESIAVSSWVWVVGGGIGGLVLRVAGRSPLPDNDYRSTLKTWARSAACADLASFHRATGKFKLRKRNPLIEPAWWVVKTAR